MSVYSDKTFRASDYNKFRPTYPQSIFDKIISYHGEDRQIDLLVDAGCGPGEGTFPYAEYPNVKNILGTDASQVMIDAANALNKRPNVKFEVSPGEDLSGVGVADASVDILTAAECVHWFNHQIWLKEVSRVLKDNGTLAYISYIDAVIMDDPLAEEINQNFTYLDPRYCGPLWQQPGKEHLRIGMRGVDYFLSKNKDFADAETKSFDPIFDSEFTELKIVKDMKLQDFLNYLDTWSAVHSWRKKYAGEDVTDIVESWYQEFNKTLGWTKDKDIKVIWKTHFTLARRVPRST